MAAPTAPPPPKTVLRVAAISGSLRRASANTGLIRAAAEICRESIPGLQIDHVDISELPLLNTDLEVDGGFPPAVEAFRDKVRQAGCFLFASPEYNYSISGPLKNALDWGSRPPNCWADRTAAMLSAPPRRFAGSPSRACRSTPSTSWSCRCSTPTSRSTAGTRRPSRRSVTRSAGPIASSSPHQSPLKNALDWGSRPPNCWADRAAAMLSASGSTGDSRSQYHIRQVGVFLDIHFINKPEVFTKAHMPPKKFDADGNLIDSETKEQVRKKLLSLQAFALRLQGKSEQGN